MTNAIGSIESCYDDSDDELPFSGRLEVPLEIVMLGVRSIRRVLVRYEYRPAWEHYDRNGNLHAEADIDVLLASSSYYTLEGEAKRFALFDDGSTDEAVWEKVRELIDQAARREDKERRTASRVTRPPARAEE